MGATSLGDADEEEMYWSTGNDRDYLGLCGIMALQDEITRGSALRDLISNVGGLNAGGRQRPKMVDGSARKPKRKRKPYKKHVKCHDPSCNKLTPCLDDDVCMIDNIFANSPKGQKRDKDKRKPKRRKEKICKEICPLGVLELAVPSKRLCIETWRQYSHVLPPCAITRLKEIILDQKPIIEVSAAVECFNLHKNMCKKLTSKRKKEKLRRMLFAKKKKTVPNRISQICAKLAGEILNYLKTPKVIKLDSDWQRLAQVIYKDMRKMLIQMNAKHLMNRHYLRDAATKGAVWVGTILEQYEDMFVYDEIRDFEEIEGPILDIIDDILDAVLEFCEPAYDKVRNSESALNYFSGDTSLDGEGGGRKGSHATHTSKGSPWDDLRVGSDWDSKRGLDDASGTYKHGIKLEKDYDLDSDIRRDIIETAGEVTRSITDMAEAAVTKSLDEMEGARRKHLEDDIIVLAKPRNSKSSESEVEAEKEQEQSLDKDPDQRSASSQTTEASDDINKAVDIINEEVDVMNIAVDENAENKQLMAPEEKSGEDFNVAFDTINPLIALDDFTNQETINEQIKREVTDVDQVEIIDGNNKPNHEIEKDSEPTPPSDKDSKRQTEQSVRRSSNVTFMNKDLKIGPVNDDLLSYADETWPKDIPFPVVKPSVSVTQSITTLGNITESEETVKDAAELTKHLTEMLQTDDGDKHEKTAEESQQPIESDELKTKQLNTTTDQEDNRDIKAEESQQLAKTDQHKEDEEDKCEKKAEESELTSETGQLNEISTPNALAKIEEFQVPLEFITIDTLDNAAPIVSKTKESEDVPKPIELIPIDSTPKEIKKPYKPKEIPQLIVEMDRGMKKVETKRQNQKLQKPVPRKATTKPATKALSPTRKDTKTIFDYKVRPETAPAWLLKRVCSCRTFNNEYVKNLQTCVLNKETIKNIFRESENLVKSLELWNRWIASTCEQIVTLKETSDAIKYVEGRCSANRCIIRQWKQLQTNIIQATKQWHHYKISTHNTLRRSQKL